MKVRMSFVVLLLTALGGFLYLGMTKAELIDVVAARLSVDFDGNGETDQSFNCWLKGGIGDESEVIEIPGGDGEPTRKRPGAVRYGDITLQFPAGRIPPALLDWFESGIQGNWIKRYCVLETLDPAGEVVGKANLSDCWPARLNALKQTRVGFRGDVVDELVFVLDRYDLVRK